MGHEQRRVRANSPSSGPRGHSSGASLVVVSVVVVDVVCGSIRSDCFC